MFTVEGGQRAVLWSRVQGVKPGSMARACTRAFRSLSTGSRRWRPRPRNVQSLTGSKDLQMVNVTLRVLFYPNKQELPWIYTMLGHDYELSKFCRRSSAATKAVVARYNASELLTKREAVSNEIRYALTKRAADFQNCLDDFALTHLSFSNEYTAAVEAKQVAQQEAERARRVVEKAIQEKKSIIVENRAEGGRVGSAGRQGLSRNPGFVKLRKIDTAKEIATTVARNQGGCA